METIPYTGDLSGFSGTCILQDRDGFMWFGSRGGLYRYDGSNIKIFRHDPENEKSISNDWIKCLSEDEDGIIWIGTYMGFNKFDKHRETFIQFYPEPGNPNSLVHENIQFLYQDDDFIWIGTHMGFSRFIEIFGKYPRKFRYFAA